MSRVAAHFYGSVIGILLAVNAQVLLGDTGTYLALTVALASTGLGAYFDGGDGE
ncbi:hypothetical protein U3A55_11795 [Salarchaeum sp. III]|uniref:hypothetical protein n=1 Tax=Salarchaeum sp. III TaxID=3107927 RepID=UPI002ED9EB16